MNAILLLHKLSFHKSVERQTKDRQSLRTEDIFCHVECDRKYRIVTHIEIERIPCEKPIIQEDEEYIDGIKQGSDKESINNDAADDMPIQSEAIMLSAKEIPNEDKESTAHRLQPTEFQCVYCKHSYKNKASCRSHMSHSHKSIDDETSTVIGQRRKSGSGRVGRPPTIMDNRTFQCRHCDEIFVNRSNYNKHVLTLRNGKPFFCRNCITGFDFRGDLIQHKRQSRECKSPPREKKYLCTYCGKYFEKKDSLRQHTRVHTKERPFECTECSRTFVNKGTLKDHMNSHLGLRPYICPVPECRKAFRLACTLKQHKMNVHEPPTFECSFCGKMFSDKKHRDTHLRVHTGEQLSKWRINYLKIANPGLKLTHNHLSIGKL